MRQSLRAVIDPELGADIVELGMVRRRRASPPTAPSTVTIALTTAGCPLRAQIQTRHPPPASAPMPGVTNVHIDWGEMTTDEKRAAMEQARWNMSQREEAAATVSPTTRVVLVASARAASASRRSPSTSPRRWPRTGLTVGVLDADIWGFSVPRMLGVEGRLEGAGARRQAS